MLQKIIDGGMALGLGMFAVGASNVTTAGLDTENILELVGIIIAAVLAFLRGRKKD